MAAKLRSNVWSFDYEGIDVDAMKKRLRKHGWYRARGSWREDKNMFPKANRYNTLLMRTAFAEDRLRKVERMRFYLRDTASDGLREKWRRVDEALNRAYQAYASLYQTFVQEGRVTDATAFGLACDALGTTVASFEDSLDESKKAMGAAARAKPAWPMPTRLGRQPRSIPAFQPSGSMSRLVIAGYGVDPFPQVPGYEHPEGNEFEYAETRGIVKPSIHTTKELAFEYDRNWVAYCRDRGYRYYACLPFGYHYWMYSPYWFLEGNQGDPDILFRSWDGLLPKPLGRFRWREGNGRLVVDSGGASVKRGEDVQLNHYHPRVREYVRDTVTQFANFCREQPEIDFYIIAGETNNYLVTEKGLRLTGYGPAATTAFRAYLKGKYGRIETLNEAWRATYGTFDDIVQPRDPYTLGYDYRGKEVLTPLMAEFRAFRNHAHAEYLKLVYETIKEADPARPVSSYYGCPFWRHANFRARLMETCDLLEFHGSSTKMSLSNIYANSLLRYHKGKGLSYLETHWSYQEHKSRFAEERVQRRALEKETYRSTVWGRTLHRRWTPHCFSVDEHYYFLHPRHDWTILRYSAPAQIVSKRILEKLDWILTHSEIVPSRLLVIDPSASIRNYGCSPNVMDRVHDFLFPRNWLYEMLPEEYLLKGKASLDSFKVIILPYAKYFPHGVTAKLIDWVKSGGVLIPIGTSGLYNELGLQDGSLLAELLNTSWEAQSSPARQERVEAQLVSRDVGRGRVLYVPHILHLLNAPAAVQILATLEPAGRSAWSRDGKLEVLVRVDEEGDTYVSVLNPSPDDAVVDTVIVLNRVQAAVDVTLPGGCSIPRSEAKSNGRTETQMEMRLGPCEWALVYCGRTRR